MIEAPAPGSGKGLLADVVSAAALGHHVGVMAEARDDDEWRKRLTAVLREGHGAIVVDNISRPLDSGVLAAALTATTWNERLLGKTETLHLPVQCVWVFTGNNPVLSTEMARRLVRIRLDPRMDRPWQREGFTRPDLRGWARTHRGELVWAALTLCKAWIAGGAARARGRPLGSYEDWSAVIGGILATAELPGFLGNMDEFYETADTEGAVWRAFVATWWEKFQSAEVGTSELFALAVETEGLDLGKGNERAQRTVFGKRLAQQRDRVIGDYRVVAGSTKQRAQQWRLLPTVDRPAQGAGAGGMK